MTGALVYTLQVRRVSTARNAAGSPVETWADLVTLRASIADPTTEARTHAQGATDEIATTFRTRFVEGITPADRLHFRGRTYRIQAVTEIGRRRGLEIRAIAQE